MTVLSNLKFSTVVLANIKMKNSAYEAVYKVRIELIKIINFGVIVQAC